MLDDDGQPRRGVLRAVLAAVAIVLFGAAAWFYGFREKDPEYDDAKHFAAAMRGPVEVPIDVDLPQLEQGDPLVLKEPVVTIGKHRLRVPATGFALDLPDDKTHGVSPKDKRGPEDLFVPALGDTLAWAKKQVDPGARLPLTVLVDRDTPYRLLVEVLFTSGQSEWSDFVFAARKGADIVHHPMSVPRVGDSLRGKNLSVLVASDGFALWTRDGAIGPGCARGEAGTAVPKAGGAYDYAALRRCLTTLKAADPDLTDETRVTLHVRPDVTAGVVYATIEVLRARDGGKELFPDFSLGTRDQAPPAKPNAPRLERDRDPVDLLDALKDPSPSPLAAPSGSTSTNK